MFANLSCIPRVNQHLGIVKRTAFAIAFVALLSGCRFFGGGEPTRTPIPTFTPTPILLVVPAGSEAGNAQEPQVEVVQQPQQPAEAAPAATDTPQPAPIATSVPTDTPVPTATTVPTDTPTPAPTPTPTPTEVIVYQFELETAQKFPTESLAPDVVRIYAYVYAQGELGLGGYRVRILHNGARLENASVSKAGLPNVTRTEPGPYTRFTNLSEIVIEAQAGEWAIQLVDGTGALVGPAAEFTLTADENTRELYVRYKYKG